MRHKMFVAAVCTRCHNVSLKVCVVHDNCEREHSEKDCNTAYYALRKELNAIMVMLITIVRIEGDGWDVITRLQTMYDRIQERE
jgi:hypothetical protein